MPRLNVWIPSSLSSQKPEQTWMEFNGSAKWRVHGHWEPLTIWWNGAGVTKQAFYDQFEDSCREEWSKSSGTSSILDLRYWGLTADAPGFFALVLSYSKAAQFSGGPENPKKLTSIMPRMDFVAMLRLAGLQGLLFGMSLYKMVKVAPCFETIQGKTKWVHRISSFPNKGLQKDL